MSENAAAPHTVSEISKDDKLSHIKLGMAVIDRLGEKVGKVGDVYGGTDDRLPRPAGERPLADDPLGPANDMAREVRERLRHDGFIRIDAGLLKHHRYALLSQVDRVEADDRVSLLVLAEDLIKR